MRVQRVEKHIIKRNHPDWKICDKLCFSSKNLYNKVNFIIRSAFLGKTENIEDFKDLIKNDRFVGGYELIKRMTELNDHDYRSLKPQSSQQVILQLGTIWKSYFKSLKSYKSNTSRFSGRPKMPSYKHKEKGRYIVTFTNQNISIKNRKIFFSRKDCFKKIRTNKIDFQQIKIVPKLDGSYHLCIIYNKEIENVKGRGYSFGVDLGLNNLMAITSDKVDFRPLLINGRPLKSYNWFWNKNKARLQSELKEKFLSKRITKLTFDRNNKVNDYLHKASRLLINKALENEVTSIVIGYNQGWKNEINIGKKNNQNFVNIPYEKLIDFIHYKAEENGIRVIMVKEEYTSKCSSLDKEEIRKHETYIGNRVKRGLFKTSNRLEINADVNGSLNILRKVIGDDFINLLNIGCVLQPELVKIV
jgi:putative transposase